MTKILVVDDNEQNLYFLKILLEGHGYETRLAANGAEALELARSDLPDLVISDLLMPTMDGFTLCREWMADDKLNNIPFVVYTATYTDSKDRNLALSLGASEFVIKPLRPESLLKIIKRVLEKSKDKRKVTSSIDSKIEDSYLKEYSEVLVRKLEKKLLHLEETNRAFEYEIKNRKLVEKNLANANLALKESEEKFRAVFEQAGDGIYLVDTTGTIFDTNQIGCDIIGYTHDELLTKPIISVLPSYDKNKYIGQYHSKGNHRQTTILSEFVRKDNSRFPVEIRFGSIQIKNANHLLIIARDITEAKRLRELETRSQRLETAGKIAGQVAHDFNNLMAPLMAYPDLIREELPKNHQVLEYINDIENSTKQIAEINQQLLTLGRRGHYNQKPLNLNNVINKIIKLLKTIPTTLEIETHLENSLMNIKGGQSQIYRVIFNLISNAREAMCDKGRLIIRTENYYSDQEVLKYNRIPIGEYVKFTISDTGCGIPEQILPQIFEPFITTKHTDEVRGSGLGLSIVNTVVEDHNGYIDVKSIEGVGTSFYIYFPITRENAKENEISQVIGGTESILVIDDDKVQRKVSKTIMEKLGYTVNTVNSGETAIEFCKKNQCDLLILDIVMPPGIDGIETFKEIQKLYPHQKAILVSGFAESESVKEAKKLGVRQFLNKPFSIGIIAKAVREELNNKIQETCNENK